MVYLNGSRLSIIAVVLSAVSVAGCSNTVPPLKGNDTGGIIAWAPITDAFHSEIAMEHCASYRKLARIRSRTPRYGEYIAFDCYFPRELDVTVLRSKY